MVLLQRNQERLGPDVRHVRTAGTRPGTVEHNDLLHERQDFEALTPNILCRTIETVEGGGMVVLLLKTMKSLKQLYTLTMV